MSTPSFPIFRLPTEATKFVIQCMEYIEM
ncbi:hypothetical protein CRE_03362 [Caenorhabditis remanei]|uniref:Uncharacterized protein n=1 Tax=Caenorhabditis remanei TaxID=31234 RepID=E3N651_CAERE|nr:hypothetical protein CRE_03362 [Caenorhabditis remanei]